MRHGIAAMALALLAVGPACGQGIAIAPNGSQATTTGPAATFTGAVTVAPLFSVIDGRPISGAQVTFSPGARTAWHSHPAGQTLIVTSGSGWVQEWNGVKREIKPGDVVWTPPGVKHWHGATATTAMSHIAIQQQIEGQGVTWMEHVSDQQYGAK